MSHPGNQMPRYRYSCHNTTCSMVSMETMNDLFPFDCPLCGRRMDAGVWMRITEGAVSPCHSAMT